MGNTEESSRLSIRKEAERFLAAHGFSMPPLPADQALTARKLVVSQLSLDDLLLKANLPPADQKKIQAMLDAKTRTVAFQRDLPEKKKDWGSLHEVAHEFIPWQRELLFYCPLLSLPAHLQEELEAEADVFAAEAFFFGNRFHKEAYSGDTGLNTAIELANKVYRTSFHATFTHYVEESPLAHCLLVWKPKGSNRLPGLSVELELHYYVKSKTFLGHIPPRQTADPDEAVRKVFVSSLSGVVKHEMVFRNRWGEEYVSEAESFSNSYNVFTLISQPQRRHARLVSADGARTGP